MLVINEHNWWAHTHMISYLVAIIYNIVQFHNFVNNVATSKLFEQLDMEVSMALSFNHLKPFKASETFVGMVFNHYKYS